MINKHGASECPSGSVTIVSHVSLLYRVRYNYGNTHFMIVLDEKHSILKIYWVC